MNSGNFTNIAIPEKYRPDHPFGEQKSNHPSNKSQQFYENYFKKLPLHSDYDKSKRNDMISCPMNKTVGLAPDARYFPIF